MSEVKGTPYLYKKGEIHIQDWQPNLYMQFGKERTQPSIDLTARINMQNPERIIDIGCGPGNSTNVLAARWRKAEITGLDSSAAMIEEAKSKYHGINWVHADAGGDLSYLGKFDIVFSNAAIQWIPNHEALLPGLFGMLNKGGVLAVQVPSTVNMPIHIELQKLIKTDKWKNLFEEKISQNNYRAENAEYFYNIICGLSAEVDLWETRYFHVMYTRADIVKWWSSTGLWPYLECFGDDDEGRQSFLADYEAALKESYAVQSDGKVLFPFTRIFFMVVND